MFGELCFERDLTASAGWRAVGGGTAGLGIAALAAAAGSGGVAGIAARDAANLVGVDPMLDLADEALEFEEVVGFRHSGLPVDVDLDCGFLI